MSYVFHPAAEAEYLESIAFYESKRPGLGATYVAELESVWKESVRHLIEIPWKRARMSDACQ